MTAKNMFVGVSPSCLSVGRAMVASFLSTSGRLRQPSLAPNVLYVICKYAKVSFFFFFIFFFFYFFFILVVLQ